MAENTPTPRTRSSNTALVVTSIWYGLMIVVGVVLLTQDNAMAGTIVLAVSSAIAPLGLLAAMRTQATAGSRGGGQAELVRTMKQIQQESGLSEAAKRVLHRRQERQLLRDAIQQDIASEDWNAALVLVNELADRFGYRADAEAFRERIEQSRSESRDREVMVALGALDKMIASKQWADAYAEAGRISRLYAESHLVRELRERVEKSRQSYRRDLERRFLEAAGHDSIDEAMALLKELDQYLTPSEAAPLEEVARGVIGKSRENLGVRFKLLVQDRQWDAAIDMGNRIIEEFPNTRMAQEVRELLPTLGERAGVLAGSR